MVKQDVLGADKGPRLRIQHGILTAALLHRGAIYLAADGRWTGGDSSGNDVHKLVQMGPQTIAPIRSSPRMTGDETGDIIDASDHLRKLTADPLPQSSSSTWLLDTRERLAGQNVLYRQIRERFGPFTSILQQEFDRAGENWTREAKQRLLDESCMIGVTVGQQRPMGAIDRFKVVNSE